MSTMKTTFKINHIELALKFLGALSVLVGIIYLLNPEHRSLSWQIIGLYECIFGICFVMTSFYLTSLWPIVFIGLILKVIMTLFLPFLFLSKESSTLLFLLIFLTNVLWIYPLYKILDFVFMYINRDDAQTVPFNILKNKLKTQSGIELVTLSNEKPVLLVIMRHFGCTFCRETVSDISKIEKSILDKGLTPVFVHMSDPNFGDEFFAKYFDKTVHHISDPSRSIYRSLGLYRGNIYQLFGPMTWIRGLYLGIIKGHGIGEIEGDSILLSGYFILDKGQITFSYKSESASEKFELNKIPNLV
jgi:hypothetical protein